MPFYSFSVRPGEEHLHASLAIHRFPASDDEFTQYKNDMMKLFALKQRFRLYVDICKFDGELTRLPKHIKYIKATAAFLESVRDLTVRWILGVEISTNTFLFEAVIRLLFSLYSPSTPITLYVYDTDGSVLRKQQY